MSQRAESAYDVAWRGSCNTHAVKASYLNRRAEQEAREAHRLKEQARPPTPHRSDRLAATPPASLNRAP
jgi:hypothetical protein